MSEKSNHVMPFLVLGESRRNRLVTRLTTCISPWLREWNATRDDQCAVIITRCTELAPASISVEKTHAVRVAAQGETLVEVFASDECLAEILGLPRHVSLLGAQTGRIATQVFNEVLQSLAQRLTDIVGTGDVSIDIVTSTDGSSEYWVSKKHWFSATVECASRRESLQLLLSPKFVAALAPSTMPVGGDKLDRRVAAIAEESMTLEAVLGEVSLTVGELASLNVNDVIVLSDGLVQPGYLMTSAGERVAGFSLGRVGKSRAVAIANR
jgi:hypothetical protein